MKVLGGVDSTEPHMPQDGRISQMVNGRRVDVRVATFPTTYGEDVAIRTLEKGKLVRGLTELGCSTKNLTLFRDILSKSRGIVLVTGPTGAGKTTTLYSALAHLGSTEKNILTVEDPVEYQIPTIRQTQIRPTAGFTFGTAIRSLLRQDPARRFAPDQAGGRHRRHGHAARRRAGQGLLRPDDDRGSHSRRVPMMANFSYVRADDNTIVVPSSNTTAVERWF